MSLFETLTKKKTCAMCKVDKKCPPCEALGATSTVPLKNEYPALDRSFDDPLFEAHDPAAAKIISIVTHGRVARPDLDEVQSNIWALCAYVWGSQDEAQREPHVGGLGSDQERHREGGGRV